MPSPDETRNECRRARAHLELAAAALATIEGWNDYTERIRDLVESIEEAEESIDNDVQDDQDDDPRGDDR